MKHSNCKVGDFVIPLDYYGGSNNTIGVAQHIREITRYEWDPNNSFWYLLDSNWSNADHVKPLLKECPKAIKLL